MVQWAEAAQPSRVIEYAAFYAPIEAHHHANKPPINPTKLVAPRPAGGAAHGTRLELSGLHAGTNYSLVVRARTAIGWGPPSEPLVTRTMRPQDFPAPLHAPSVAKLEGCTALRLRLPALETCDATAPMKWDLEVARGEADDWRVLVPDTPGGDVSAVGMEPSAAARFRLSSRALLPNRPSAKVTHGEPTPPLLPGVGAAALLRAPHAVATSSASVRLSWSTAADPCRPNTAWEVQFTRDEMETGVPERRQLQPRATPPPPPPLATSSARRLSATGSGSEMPVLSMSRCSGPFDPR